MPCCTWEGCKNEAVREELDKNGQRWAHLCEEHHVELDAAIGCMDAKKTVRAWVKAKGGAKAAADQMAPAAQEAISKLMGILRNNTPRRS